MRVNSWQAGSTAPFWQLKLTCNKSFVFRNFSKSGTKGCKVNVSGVLPTCLAWKWRLFASLSMCARGARQLWHCLWKALMAAVPNFPVKMRSGPAARRCNRLEVNKGLQLCDRCLGLFFEVDSLWLELQLIQFALKSFLLLILIKLCDFYGITLHINIHISHFYDQFKTPKTHQAS